MMVVSKNSLQPSWTYVKLLNEYYFQSLLDAKNNWMYPNLYSARHLSSLSKESMSCKSLIRNFSNDTVLLLK